MGPLPQAQVRTRSGRSETARCTTVAHQSWPTRSTGAPARSTSRTSQSTYASLVASKLAGRAHPKPGKDGATTSARRRRARSGAHRRCVSGTPWTRTAGTKASLARRRTRTPPARSCRRAPERASPCRCRTPPSRARARSDSAHVDSARSAKPVTEGAPIEPARPLGDTPARRVRGGHGAARRRLPLRRSAAHTAHGDPRRRDALGRLGAALGPAPRRQPCAPPRRRRRGGRPLLRAPRRRLDGPRARPRVQRALAGPAAPRRGHHHDAMRPHRAPVARTELRAEGARGLPRLPARARVGEAAHPRGVRQHRRVGRRRLRRRGGRAAILRGPRGAARCVAVGAPRRRAAEPAAMEPGRADAVPPSARGDHRGARGAGPALLDDAARPGPAQADSSSGLEELPPPPCPRPHEELALVQAVLPVRPELDRLGDDAEARPRRRPRHRPPALAPPQLPPARDERAAARERGALLRGERRELARPRPRGPVRIGLCRRDLLHAPLDAHLPPQPIPVEGDGRARSRTELAALAAAAVGEEDEAAAVGGLQEDEANRGRAATPGGGERHRLGERDAGALGGPEPAAEAREGLGQEASSTPQEKTRAGVTSTITTSDSSSAASSGYCGYFA